jgi:hypothetical protein
MTTLPTDEELARQIYESMRERYGVDAFHPWEALAPYLQRAFAEQIRQMREVGALRSKK